MGLRLPMLMDWLAASYPHPRQTRAFNCNGVSPLYSENERDSGAKKNEQNHCPVPWKRKHREQERYEDAALAERPRERLPGVLDVDLTDRLGGEPVHPEPPEVTVQF